MMKKLLPLLLGAVMLTACANKTAPIDEITGNAAAKQTNSSPVIKTELSADTEYLNNDFSTKRVIANAEIKRIEEIGLDGLKYAKNNNGSTCLLEFYSEDYAKAANKRLQKASIYCEPDILMKADVSLQADAFKSWGVSATGMDDYQSFLKSRNNIPEIIVAVLDTGVDSSHPMLKGRVISGWNFVNGSSNANDKHGHGTHVSGTIAESTLTNVKIMPVKVLDDSGRGYSSDMTTGIRWAADNGARVINLSLGGVGRLQATRDAIKYANSKGSVVVVSAGNENDDASFHDPAWVPEAVTVAAHDKQSKRASFSNYGDVIDVSGPGVAITSAVPGNSYKTWSGTSMSAPHISAAVALLTSDSRYNNLSPDAIQEKIKEAAEDFGAPGFDKYYGNGGLNLEKLISESEPPVSEPNPPVSEPDPPVSEPDPPVTEPNPPVSEPDPPVSEPNPPVIEPNPPLPGTPIRIGDIIKLGGYDWSVLDVKNGKALVISVKVLALRQYHANRKDNITWENSDIRGWLNSSFYNSTFTEQEKKLISATKIANKDNQWHGTAGGNYTTDKVFLLSLEEVVKYFGDSGQLNSKPNGKRYINDKYNPARVALNAGDSKARWWWLRSPGNSTNRAACINNDGDIDPRGDIADNKNGGIRPAMWIVCD